jgi:enoyl-CoA hydratase/carnithine racemase
VGISQALEWVYSGDILTAEEAQQGRLVKAIYAPDELLNEAYKLAHKFVDNRSPVAVALARQLMYRNSAENHPLEAHKSDSLAMFYTSVVTAKKALNPF